MDDIVFMLSFGFLLLVLLAVIACTKGHLPPHRSPAVSEGAIYQLNIKIEQGLDEATLHSFPDLLYSEAKAAGKNARSSVFCPICLLDYEETDRLRLLADCDHLFHLHCVDPWLRLHATCPLCRNSPALVNQPGASTEITVALPAVLSEAAAPIAG